MNTNLTPLFFSQEIFLMNLPTVLTLSSSIFLGTFISGSLPLLLPLSDLTMRLASAYGAGLLVGVYLPYSMTHMIFVMV